MFMPKNKFYMFINRKLFFVAFLIVLTVASILANAVFREESSNEKINSENTLTEDEKIDLEVAKSNDELASIADKYRIEQEKNTQQYIDNIDSLDKLKNIELLEQDIAGIAVINNLVNNGNTEEAQEFIDFVMTFETSSGIEAAKICYQTANTDIRKSECVTILTNLAIQQGIIKEGEVLPESYYELNNQEIG
jgi:hypothetical protein